MAAYRWRFIPESMIRWKASCNIRLRSLLRLRYPFCQAGRLRFSGQKGDIPRLQPARNSPLKHCSNLEALRIFPSFSWSGNAAAGSAASRCTESALSRRACELRKASCNTHCVRSYTCGFAVLSAERIAVGSPGRKASTAALQCVAVYCSIWRAGLMRQPQRVRWHDSRVSGEIFHKTYCIRLGELAKWSGVMLRVEFLRQKIQKPTPGT